MYYESMFDNNFKDFCKANGRRSWLLIAAPSLVPKEERYKDSHSKLQFFITCLCICNYTDYAEGFNSFIQSSSCFAILVFSKTIRLRKEISIEHMMISANHVVIISEFAAQI